MSDRFLTNLNNEEVTQKIKTYIWPDNCPNLVVPKYSTEVWQNLSKFQRRADLKVPHVQRSINVGSAAIIQILDLLLANSKSPQSLQIPQLVSKGCDSLALFGHAVIRESAIFTENFREYAYSLFLSNICFTYSLN